ncbi:unnamed protein product, partial [Iphiclides podalirius]
MHIKRVRNPDKIVQPANESLTLIALVHHRAYTANGTHGTHLIYLPAARKAISRRARTRTYTYPRSAERPCFARCAATARLGSGPPVSRGLSDAPSRTALASALTTLRSDPPLISNVALQIQISSRVNFFLEPRASPVAMVRTKDADGIKSSQIVSEVERRPCLFDTNHANYGDRAAKARCWDEVCESVVPGWRALGQAERLTAGTLDGRFANDAAAERARRTQRATRTGRVAIVACDLRCPLFVRFDSSFKIRSLRCV